MWPPYYVNCVRRRWELRIKIIGLLGCLGMILFCCVGCGSESRVTETPRSTATPQPTATLSQSPLVVPVAADSPVSTPLSPAPTPRPSCLTQIEPVGNTVCGYVVTAGGVPIVGRPVFLARALFLSDNSAVFATLDRQNAPQGVLDENGLFYMTGVRSDLYFVMIDDYPQPMMLKEPDNPRDDLIVDWRESGGEVDLGTITSNVYVTPVP
jgi:hypothetical protein